MPQGVSVSDGNVYCVYNVFNTDAVVTKTSFNDYDRYEVQVSFFSADLNAALTAAESARTTLDRYTGTITVDAVNYNVQLIRFVNQEFVGFDEDTQVFMVAADYKVTMTQ